MRLTIPILTALLLAAPVASALPYPPAADATFCVAQELLAEEATRHCAPLGTYTSDGETYYVTPIGPYRESNGCAGLQTIADDCDGDGDVDPRDRRLTVGELAEGRGVPDV